ncbi:hypothetical protein [Burkholderia cepacia]|uniref:Uncharacterized protein n=1 Tax=Burkholderia cepacia TaxID=292 RepID=A0A8I1AU95_BURCE|nr:hypothetical protein [Burkholderia cepacia]MBA9902667.1 hypothetical protein [Burkholderia cepacia]MBA9946540.1 hypothetical protein [Burkholderia cepacia]MBA9974337.1 hypothetical protein [Burkholderia cepacia]MBA9995310.1 hypothetical protein [Burkholderia cepacia]MBB0000765.1 hypothetical protein [Burkholderia cepacia]
MVNTNLIPLATAAEYFARLQWPDNASRDDAISYLERIGASEAAYTPVYAARLLTEDRIHEQIKMLCKMARLTLYDPVAQQPTINVQDALVSTLDLAQLLTEGVVLSDSVECELSARAAAWKGTDEFERRLFDLHEEGVTRPLHLHEWFKRDNWTPRNAIPLLLGLEPEHDWFALANESGTDITIVSARWLDGSLVCLDGWRNANVFQLEIAPDPSDAVPDDMPLTSLNLLDMSVRLSQMMAIWDSGDHPPRNPPAYYLKWAHQKGYIVPWLEWARAEGIVDGMTVPAPEHVQRSTPETNNAERMTDSDWISRARELAQEIGERKWRSGQRQITARNIDGAVAAELGKDPSCHGKQGPRSASNVRSVALKGWKFFPPDGMA